METKSGIPTQTTNQSDPRPFINHMLLAKAWLRWNGQKATELQTAKMMRQLTAEQLSAMLKIRGIAI